MAGSLNRAFMRAYAKDRAQAKLDAAAKTNPDANTPPTQPVPPAPQIFSSRYSQDSAEKRTVAPTKEAAPVRRTATANYRSDSVDERTNLAVQQTTTHPSPGPHAPAQQAPAQYAPVHQSMPQGEHDFTHGDYDQKAMAPSNFDVGPEGVWQRIDNAHRSSAPSTAQRGSRPLVSSMAATGEPVRTHVAAVHSASHARIDRAKLQPNEIDTPLLSDVDEAANPSQSTDSESNELRRRSVADFLYTAGQVMATRQLPTRVPTNPYDIGTSTVEPSRSATPLQSVQKSAQNAPVPTRVPTPASSSPLHAPIQSNYSDYQPENQSQYSQDYARQDYAGQYEADYGPGHDVEHYGPMEPAVEPRPSGVLPIPHRTGQILRVDVPRGPRPDEARARQASPATVPASSPAKPAQPVGPVGRVAPQESLAARVDKKTLVEQEQRRMEVAIEASEVEQKLRSSQHKIFNPVWEVDSLQWPGVCEKLMEQRAQSMAQVAAHLKMACQDGLSVLGVTSSSKGEGRTTVACCLARLASMHGLTVALIDLDLDNPTLCLQTNMEVEQDWRDTLESETTLEDVAVHSIDDQLTILPLKPRGGRPGILSSDQRLAEILAKISESFDLVIVDTCRLNSTGNVIAGLSKSKIFDAAIVVVDRRNSNQERVDQSVRTLQDAGIESIGIVDNFSS